MKRKPKPTSKPNLNLVADNPNCTNCIYRDKGSIFRWYCNYLEMEDEPRGCDVNGCMKKIEKVKKKKKNATAGEPKGWELTKEEQLALKRKRNKQFHTRRVFTHFCKDWASSSRATHRTRSGANRAKRKDNNNNQQGMAVVPTTITLKTTFNDVNYTLKAITYV